MSDRIEHWELRQQSLIVMLTDGPARRQAT
jgi:hypothetical protein